MQHNILKHWPYISSIEAARIARELISVFARMGMPEKILSDQGTNFMSALLEKNLSLAADQTDQDYSIPPSNRWIGGAV